MPQVACVLPASKPDKLQAVAFHTEGELFAAESAEDRPSTTIVAFVGPEGGWSEAEVEQFHKEGIAVKSLGRQVLRAETAVVAILAKLVFG